MVLGIHLFRNTDDLDRMRDSQQKRFADPVLIDHVVELDQQVRLLRQKISDLRRDMKLKQTEIVRLKKSTKGSLEEIQKMIEDNKKLGTQLKETTQQEKDLSEQIQSVIAKIGNLVHDSVPISDNEKNNQIIRTWGEVRQPIGCLAHHKLLEQIGGYSQKRGVKVIGHRGYFLTGIGVKLNRALQQYALDFLEERGYQFLQPPFLMNAEIMAQTAELEDFRETLYQVNDGNAFLIATSEQPISAYHAGEVLLQRDLPIKYAGISTCFRKEAGAHGKETWGIFRVHQFEKIEQFVITEPGKSWEAHEEMIHCAEEFYQSLGLSYRVVSIVSGALNNAAAKKYDLEAWFPSYGDYKELVSCSNCTDYQSLNLKIKIDGDKGFAHLLNGTLCATERTICCLLENYQTSEGIVVPKVLRPYLKNQELIPYI